VKRRNTLADQSQFALEEQIPTKILVLQCWRNPG